MPLIDLTSLGGGETRGRDRAPVPRAPSTHGTAAVCIYAERVPLARPRARRAAPCGSPPSPTSRTAATTSRRAAEETAAAVAAGADEVDVVAPIGALLRGRCRPGRRAGRGLPGRCRPGHHAEADPGDRASCSEPDLITAAARAAVMAGVDFLKTSTGKTEVGATLEAAAALLAVIAARPAAGSASRPRAASAPRPTPRAISISPTRSWARTGRSPRTFRFGASSLLDDLLGRGGEAAGGY